MVVLQAFIKTAAVSGIAFFWVIFTVESLKLAWHIISASPEPIVKQKVMCESCNGYFLDDGGESCSDDLVKQKVMCESCYGYFLDDGDELIHGKFLCESCSDDLVRDQLNK